MKLSGIIVALIVLGLGLYVLSSEEYSTEQYVSETNSEQGIQSTTAVEETEVQTIPENFPEITAIEHASAVVEWEGVTVFVDPVGDQSQYVEFGAPDIVVITHIHPDHLSVDTMTGIISRETVILAPKSVIDEVPQMIANNVTTPLEAGSRQEVLGIAFDAIPAYNVRPEAQQFHPRERGDIGVVMERDGARIYFSGDTEGAPEMLALENIDTAFVAMNLPFTMGVEDAAAAVAAFSPRVVTPYHYRGSDGFSDLDMFEQTLFELNPAVQVERMEWY